MDIVITITRFLWDKHRYNAIERFRSHFIGPSTVYALLELTLHHFYSLIVASDFCKNPELIFPDTHMNIFYKLRMSLQIYYRLRRSELNYEYRRDVIIRSSTL